MGKRVDRDYIVRSHEFHRKKFVRGSLVTFQSNELNTSKVAKLMQPNIQSFKAKPFKVESFLEGLLNVNEQRITSATRQRIKQRIQPTLFSDWVTLPVRTSAYAFTCD